ncbi:protein-glutamine gamma-glutamyltransferase K-like [Diadema antillarum]|uniref:protein-glutamine gamma-glutamyltransferase K-like n=1 Tax=Diadema antillarum TaxID=105358 RepID=UPI003A88282C
MVRRSSRTRHTTRRFGYSSRFEPYARKAVKKSDPGRRDISIDPIVIEKAKETVKQLKVKELDTLQEANRKAHHTDEYEMDQLILRRGQTFNLSVTFDRPYNSAKDTLSLELLMGTRPSVGSGTRVPIDLVTKAPDADDFGLQVVSSSGSKVSLKVYLACDALVGEYTLVVCTQTEKEDEYRFEHPDEVIILFNPWCKKDEVYMEKDDWRKEYVMNEEGMYFYGTAEDIGGSDWYQGQFEEVALECALRLLHKSGMTYRNRASAIHVCRILSALLESVDGVPSSTLERVAVYTASRYVKKNKNFRANIKQDVQFTVELPKGVMIGSDFTVKVTSKNIGTEKRTGSVTLTGSTVYYTGVRKNKVISTKRSFSINPGESETETFTIDAADYMPELTEYAGFTFFAMARVTQTQQAFSTQKEFVLKKPTLKLETADEVKVGKSISLAISFTNPLDKPLRNPSFRIEGPGIDGYKVDKFRIIQPHESITHKVRLTPKRKGYRKFLASFTSDLLPGVKGSTSLDVLPA